MNRVGLAKLAQKIFASCPGEIICVGAETVINRCDIVPNPMSILNAG